MKLNALEKSRNSNALYKCTALPLKINHTPYKTVAIAFPVFLNTVSTLTENLYKTYGPDFDSVVVTASQFDACQNYPLDSPYVFVSYTSSVLPKL